MNRRTVLKIGAGLGLAGLAGYRVLPPAPSRELGAVDALARDLYDTLDAEQRADACVAYDDPLRQYHNRGVWGGGRDILFGFTRRQRRLLTDLMHAGLSSGGRRRVPKEYFARLSGVHGMRALICGNPAVRPYQVILTGAHVNLRIGGASREGAAFGGPQVYGDQRGNFREGLPDNLYRDQFLLAQRIFRQLDPAARARALLDGEPVQTSLELQGAGGSLGGVPIAGVNADARRLAHQLVGSILATYPPGDVAFAAACLEANGGIDRLHLSYYQRGTSGAIPEAQVFRLEGPAAVLHFRGHPHVHAFVNIAMSAGAPLSSGELLGDNPAWLEITGVKALFESAMRTQTGAELAYYPEDSVAGRLRPGLIRAGDIYALESWQEAVVVVEVHGSTLTDMLAEQLAGWPDRIDRSRLYTVATTEYAATDLQPRLGRIDARRRGPRLREAAIAHLKARGFAPAPGRS